METKIVKVDPFGRDIQLIPCAEVRRRGDWWLSYRDGVRPGRQCPHARGGDAYLKPRAVRRITPYRPCFAGSGRLSQETLKRLYWSWRLSGPGRYPALCQVRPGSTGCDAGLPTVAIRMPDHPVAQRLIDLAGSRGCPFGQFVGKLSPTTFEDTLKDLKGRVDITSTGTLGYRVESTVLDISALSQR